MELTNLLEKVSTNLLHTSGKHITPDTVEKDLDLSKIQKYLPFIQSYITAKKIRTSKISIPSKGKEKEDKNKKKGRR